MKKDIRKPLGTIAPSFGSEDGGLIGCRVRTTEVVQHNIDYTINVVHYIRGDGKTSTPQDWQTKVMQRDNGRIYSIWKCMSVELKPDSTLINVSDFIPTLDIRLDLSHNPNFFTIGGEKIPNLTMKQFYHNPGSYDGTECWLKMEPAKKLLQAQQIFIRDGYGIVVYDAYRPHSVSKEINSSLGQFLKEKGEEFKAEWFGTLGQEWFLAQQASAHNYGIAVDISLKELITGKELKMPTKVHTLDKRSAYDYWHDEAGDETENALYLREVMQSVGFTPLQSEWWHFSDQTIPKGRLINLHN